MDMKTIVRNWKKNAERNKSLNFRFLRSLKSKREKAVDRTVWRLHQEAFSIIDCTRCANCCKIVSPLFTSDDIERIAGCLGMETTAFVEKYLVKPDDEEAFEPKSLPCPLLGSDNLCMIYEVRPKTCAEYPHTNKRYFASRTHLHLDNTLCCPAVFYIVEQMRARR